MKTASKIFIGLSIAFNSIFILVLIILSNCYSEVYKDATSAYFFVYSIESIISIIIGIFAIHILNTATQKKNLTAIGILTLIFNSIVGGILMLCMSNNDLKDNKISTNNNPTYININATPQNDNPTNNNLMEKSTDNKTTQNQNVNKTESMEKELQSAKSLYDNKLIDEDEYKKMVSKIIDKY
jgi:hypothetical protein